MCADVVFLVVWLFSTKPTKATHADCNAARGGVLAADEGSVPFEAQGLLTIKYYETSCFGANFEF